jgi:CubicO group peptidase (beta-lactamase class C family)
LEDKRATPEQMDRMKAMAREAMEAGAIGLSTSLIYPPAIYAPEEEITELAKVAGEYGGRYYTHMRNEGDQLLEAIDEALRIGKAANTPVHIFHLKTAGRSNWGKMDLAIARIKAARAAGQEVGADVYPYVNNGLGIRALIHPRHSARGPEDLLGRLNDQQLRAEIRREMETGTGWENWFAHAGHDWDRIMLGRIQDPAYAQHNGKSLGEIARTVKQDPWDVFFSIARAGAFAMPQSMSEANKIKAMKQDFVSFDTDAGPVDEARLGAVSHPRGFGAFPRVIARYVRDLGALTLEEAIHRMTAVAANEIMAYDCGRLASGLAADIAIFDPNTIRDRATFGEPDLLSEGMKIVIVNGVVVIEDGKFTGATPGKVLRGPGLMIGQSPAQAPNSPRQAMIARAKALELGTKYVPPPGDPLEHHAAGFAKIMCSAVFITGLDPGFAAENVGYFTAPYPERAKLGKPVIDRDRKLVHVTLPTGVKRTAIFTGSQGCVTLPSGRDSLNFKPVAIKSRLPDPSKQPWPMGDVLPEGPLPKEIDAGKLNQAVDAAFKPAAGMTAAFVVTWKGGLIAERYGEGITARTPLESWSMGKSLTATLMGILIKQGVYDLWGPAPVPEWQSAGDPRAKIRIADILNMSSGIRIRAPQDPDHDSSGPYPDHLYLYTGGVNSFHYAATRPQQWPPGKVGRYRNTDPVLINYLVRLGVEKRGEEYLSFPQHALFDKIGIRTMVMETDPFGNFLTQGYEFASGRDWARLGNLYLQDGVWNGERILPEGFVKFVSTLAPAWEADKRPIYGGFFWINGDGAFPVPVNAYFMAGAGGQTTMIIPSHDLVVVRLGHYRGSGPGDRAFKKALSLLIEALPQRK